MDRYSIYFATEVGELPEDGLHEVQIAPIGKWKHPQYGEVVLTEEMLADAVKRFEESKAREIQLNYDHKLGKASGWMKKIFVKAGEGLFAAVKFTKSAMELIKNGEYKYISPELRRNAPDKVSGKVVPLRVTGAALTNQPYFDGMEALSAFSEDTDEQTMMQIYAGDSVEARFEEEKKELENKLEIERTKRMNEKFKPLFEAFGMTFSEDAEVYPMIEKYNEAKAQIEKLTKDVETVESEKAELEEKIKVAEEEAFSEKVNALEKELVEAGKVLPVDWKEFIAPSLNQDNFDEKAKHLREREQIVKFDGAGIDGGGEIDADVQIQRYNEAIEEIVKEKGLSFAAAERELRVIKPELIPDHEDYK